MIVPELVKWIGHRANTKEAIIHAANMQPNRRILDLFAGPGNLSLEALATGANHSFLVEGNPLLINLLLAVKHAPNSFHNALHSKKRTMIKRRPELEEQEYDRCMYLCNMFLERNTVSDHLTDYHIEVAASLVLIAQSVVNKSITLNPYNGRISQTRAFNGLSLISLADVMVLKALLRKTDILHKTITTSNVADLVNSMVKEHKLDFIIVDFPYSNYNNRLLCQVQGQVGFDFEFVKTVAKVVLSTDCQALFVTRNENVGVVEEFFDRHSLRKQDLAYKSRKNMAENVIQLWFKD